MIPLTTRSHFSLMWGTASIKKLVRHAATLGYTRLALTDTDNLYGLWPFLTACEKAGIRPIVGAELSDPKRPLRAICLVKNTAGYRHLCQLITRRKRRPNFNLMTALPRRANGLRVLTQDPAALEHWHAHGVAVAAALPRRPLPSGHPLCLTARRLDLPLVATPGSFFLRPADYAFHRLLRAIDQNTALSRLDPRQTAPKDAWLADADTYRQRFAVCPEAIAATEALADQLTFSGPNFGLVMPPWQPDVSRTDGASAEADQLTFTGPNFGLVMPPWQPSKAGSAPNANADLRAAAYAGACRRYGDDLPEPVVERLEHELAIIAQMGFSSYFLVVEEIVTRSPRTCGRGSGAASLVAYCLGITNVCPVKHNLYFGRFLNPGRSDPPDIDVDFAWDERDAVIEEVLERHQGHAAMVCSQILFQPRMAVREVAKVYGLTDGEIGQVAKRLPWFFRTSELDHGLLANLRQRPETRHLDFIEPWPEILKLAQQLIGHPRYLSVHPGGVVITPDPIDHYVPVETAPKGVPIIQWEKEATETAGLVKIDLLGNRSLGVIRDAVANVHANGVPLDEDHWEPEDDLDTQAEVAQGRTMGCFYIESPAMRLLHQKAAVGDFEHLVIHSSIIRPAANEFIQEYIRRLHGGAWDPIHPLLADVLDETFGIMVYQEDVSRTAKALAGFSDAEADGLRKILSKKDKQRELADYQGRFMRGARRKGVGAHQIRAVWEMMLSFSGYSFCKPHSASYARVSFQAAYLKTHHPAEFIAAVISNQGGFYGPFAYVSEARRMGLTILPPCVNRSEIRWTGREGRVRVGLMAVKGLCAKVQKRIVDARQSAPYHSVTDFLERVRPDEDQARSLINSGALDCLAPDVSAISPCRTVKGLRVTSLINSGALDSSDPTANRPALRWQLAEWLRRRTQNRKHKPADLFAPPSREVPCPPLPAEDAVVRLRREFAALGFLCTTHPMTLFKAVVEHRARIKVIDLPRFIGRKVSLAAWLITGKVVHTKKGDPMEFLTFEDETGIVETTWFPEAYRRFCHMVDRGRPYLLRGRVEQDWGALTLTVDGARALLTQHPGP
jgi:error-prone DNA polymerase